MSRQIHPGTIAAYYLEAGFSKQEAIDMEDSIIESSIEDDDHEDLFNAY